MEELTTFDVQVDFSDCQLLYDYGREQYIQRPEEGWEALDLKSRCSETHLADSNESMQTRIKLTDKAHCPVGCFEKQANNGDGDLWNSFSSLQREQKLPQRVLPVYSPGDVVKGAVVLEASKDIKAERLKFKLSGNSYVKIRVYHGKGYYDDIGSDDYVKQKVIYWEQSSSKDEKSDVSDTFALLDTTETIRSKYISAGFHRFTFSFTLPHDAKGSVPPLIQSYCDVAYLTYTLKATLCLGKIFGRGDQVATKGLWVHVPYDIANIPKSLEPVTAEEVLQTGVFSKSGRIAVTATLPRSAFIRKETIPISVMVENGNNNPVNKVSARVILSGRVQSGTGKLRAWKNLNIKSEKADGGSVAGDSVQQIKLDIPLDFSETYIDSNLIPVGTLDDIRLLQVRYEVLLKLRRKGFHRDIDIKIPLIIGNLNSKEESATNLYPSLT